MKILISPSKSINFDINVNRNNFTTPYFSDEISYLVSEMKKFSVNGIAELMNISDNLANLNYERYQSFSSEFDLANSKPAAFIFSGDVYDPIKVDTYNAEEIDFMQNSLRILSGLYGILRPLDLIQPYRLEMSIRLQNKNGSNLYKFWDGAISKFLNEDSNGCEPILNLASNEYFDAVRMEDLDSKVIKADFKELRSGKLKTIGIMAKKARGEMVNFIMKNKISDPNEIKDFKVNGYEYDEKISDSNSFIFTRSS